MKKIIAAVFAVVAILFAGMALTEPAQAATQSTDTAIPPDVSSPAHKFWTPNICIDGSQINGTYYPVAALAQQWNLRAPILNLDYSDDCVVDGYTPSTRMVIGSAHGGSGGDCFSVTNTGYYTTLNGWHRWTNVPAAYLNIDNNACVGSQARRSHLVSMAIGWILGLQTLNSTGYNSRVMNQTAYSYDNITAADQNSGNTLEAVYAYAYCQPFGTVC